MKCSKCGTDLTPNQKFCGSCGKPVEIDKSKIRKCSKCQTNVKLTEKFCTNCGTPVREEEDKIICQGKKADGTTCYAELSDSDRFCPECGTPCTQRNETIDELDSGKDDTNENAIPVSEIPVKEEIGHADFYEPPPEVPEEPSVIQEEKPKEMKRGLAVICTHSKFIQKTHALSKRDSAQDDLDKMETLWESYGFEVIKKMNGKSDFYNNKLIKEIEAKLETLPDIEKFVFVLSSHGEEREEKVLHEDDKHYEHYFFTHDGDCSTQNLMNKIAKVQKLENKLKIFIIQACRSRATGENIDESYEIETTGTQVQSQNGKDTADAKGIPTEEDIPANNGIDKPDAKGYMPPPEEDDTEYLQPTGDMSHACSSGPAEFSSEMPIVNLPSTEGMSHACSSEPAAPFSRSREVYIPPNEDMSSYACSPRPVLLSSQPSIEEVEEEHTIQAVPHCDDCIVMFASMSGKYAYSKSNSILSGGWLIKAIEDVIKRYRDEERVHIFDVMTEVNREVGQKEVQTLKEAIKIVQSIDAENEGELKQKLCGHMNSLKFIQENNSSKAEIRGCKDDLDLLNDRINKANTTEDMLKLKVELEAMTQKIAIAMSSVYQKAQSNFFHNLAFGEEDLYLYKNKSDKS